MLLDKVKNLISNNDADNSDKLAELTNQLGEITKENKALKVMNLELKNNNTAINSKVSEIKIG